jgi:hypothetical protein
MMNIASELLMLEDVNDMNSYETGGACGSMTGTHNCHLVLILTGVDTCQHEIKR